MQYWWPYSEGLLNLCSSLVTKDRVSYPCYAKRRAVADQRSFFLFILRMNVGYRNVVSQWFTGDKGASHFVQVSYVHEKLSRKHLPSFARELTSMESPVLHHVGHYHANLKAQCPQTRHHLTSLRQCPSHCSVIPFADIVLHRFRRGTRKL